MPLIVTPISSTERAICHHGTLSCAMRTIILIGAWLGRAIPPPPQRCPATGLPPSREIRHQPELRTTDQPDPDDLAGEQLSGSQARQKHLDDPAGLLLYYADQ